LNIVVTEKHCIFVEFAGVADGRNVDTQCGELSAALSALSSRLLGAAFN
jgi:hypothetical protein